MQPLRLLIPLLGILLMSTACVRSSPPAPASAPQSAVPETEFRATPGAGEQLGANLPPITDYSRTHVYVDLVHQARRFGLPDTPWDEKAILGLDGWPTGDFGIFLMTAQKGVKGIPGTYHVSFTGQAQVSLVASKGTLYDHHYDASQNRSTIQLDLPDDADQLALAFRQTSQGVRDLQVIRPGYDPAHPPLFTKEFLDHIARFKTLRFMDWLRTNNNPAVRWEDRPSTASIHYASNRGVPWEHIIELANLQHKDIWINIPGRANDDYVRQLAHLLKNRLAPASKIYLEYSNEVWNGQFTQHAQNFDEAEVDARQSPSSPLSFDGRSDRATVGYRRIAWRGKQISDLFREVYGEQAMMTTVRPIFATQVVNPYATRLGLEFIAHNFGAPSQYFYALAGAPYFNLGDMQNQDNLNADQVLGAMEKSIETLPRINHFEENLTLARWYGLPFLAYEGGADTFGSGSIQAKKTANMMPQMQTLCQRYLHTWYASGGGLFMWFDAGAGNWDSPYGAWELTTDLAITDTPKIRCLDNTLASPPTPAQGRNTIPGIIDALAYAGNFPPYGRSAKDHVRHLPERGYLDYLVIAPSNALYEVQLIADTSTSGNSIDIATNGGMAQATIALSPSDNYALKTTAHHIYLHQGLNTLRLTVRKKVSDINLRGISIRETTP